MKFDSFLCEPVIWKYKYGKMNFVNAFIVGLQSNVKAKQNLNIRPIFMFLKQVNWIINDLSPILSSINIYINYF
jgi:hypothetical protein